ncbi:hypothetical protein OAL29_00835 [Candidatus Binatia bacterium]|nr:hypothetical protein [Candidatus Binatia bacterium]
MAIVDKPEEYLPDNNSASFEEGDDVAQENLEMDGVVGWVESRYTNSNKWRDQDEARWLKSYRNYRGIYGPETQFTDSEKSQAFIKITKTKVLAAYAQIVDVLFAGSKFPIGIEAPKNTLNVADSVSFDPKEVTEDKVAEVTGAKVSATIARPDIMERLGPLSKNLSRVEEDLRDGPGKTPTSFTFEPAKEIARGMEKMIHDQLEESDASKHLRNVAFEMSLFGTGILKGPFAFDKEYPRWDEEGEYNPLFKVIPKIESVSIWDFYPDPDARNINEAEYVIQRHRMSRTQLRALKNRPHFRDESIEIAIEYGANYQPEYWETALEDNDMNPDVNRYEVLEYWGMIDLETAQDADIDIPEKYFDRDQIQVNAWVCNNQLLRLVINPFTPSRIPFHAVPYEVNPYSFFGVGLAENMEDTQEIMNGFMRMAVDNAALSSNLLIEIDETNLVPGQDLSVYPGKIFRRQAGAPGQAIFGTKFPNVTNECLMMFDKARQLSDEATGMPSYAHGMSGVMSVGRTASGMSMLMGAAAQNIKAVVRNMDDYMLSPLGHALFAFNMQFSFDKDAAKGNLEVTARGTESLMRNEIRSQRLIQFMQMTANPAMAPFVKYDYILREMASSMDLDEEKILNDPREAAIQAKMMAEIAALMPQPPQGAPEGPMPPGMGDPTGNGNGNIAPGAAPEPGAPGFAGAGGGDNGGQQPAPPQPQGPAQ